MLLQSIFLNRHQHMSPPTKSYIIFKNITVHWLSSYEKIDSNQSTKFLKNLKVQKLRSYYLVQQNQSKTAKSTSHKLMYWRENKFIYIPIFKHKPPILGRVCMVQLHKILRHMRITAAASSELWLRMPLISCCIAGKATSIVSFRGCRS